MKKALAAAGIGITGLAILQPLYALATEDKEKKSDQREEKSSALQVSIHTNGNIDIAGAQVSSVTGQKIGVSTTWGSLIFNWTINTSTSTKFTRRFGGTSSISDVHVGDTIHVSGTLDTSVSTPTVNAVKVTNVSLQTAKANFQGTIQSIDTAGSRFSLATKNRGVITVHVASSTIIRKANNSISFSGIHAGDHVTDTSGLYNNTTHVLEAEKIMIREEKAVLKKTTFEGTLLSAEATSTPTSFMYKSGNTTYRVMIGAGTAVLKKNWMPATLSEYKVGDHVRVYGSVDATVHTQIHASVVRDTDLK